MAQRTVKKVAFVIAGAALLGVAALVAYAAVSETPMPEPAEVDWDAERAGPVDELAVYWVGHSLFNHRDALVDDAPHLMEQVGALAEDRGLAYRGFDHTLFGANLSLAVRGEAHSYSRREPELAAKREELRTNAADYDALVVTDGIPVRNAERTEHSAFYAKELYCDFTRGNPRGRMYLYEGPVHLQASDPDGGFGPRDEFGWASWTEDDRAVWERIADQAATGDVPTPGLGPRLNAILRRDSGERCESRGPIFLIPTATVLVHLSERMAEPGPDDVFELAGGDRLRMEHLFQNPYADWPETWPLPPHEGPELDEESVIEGLTPLHPEADLDDVHPSRIGTYVAGLIAWSVLYRRSPVQEPVDAALVEETGLSAETIATLQRFVWEAVLADPRTGVAE